MASQITNYQCMNCTGPLQFVGETERLICEHCGSVFTVSEIEKAYDSKALKSAEAASHVPAAELNNYWSDEEVAKLRSYSCPSCGAELIFDNTTAASSCPYCSNPTIVPKQLSGLLKPDYIIPFRLDKNTAIEALQKHYKKKRFLPKDFSNNNHVQEIKGVYVPFWIFTAMSNADIRFRGTKVHTYSTGRENVTVTDHFDLFRRGSIAFDRIPVDGSQKMPDAHMEAIEPYDYSDMREFSLAYLPGFMADKYDVEAKDCIQRANERMKVSTEEAFKNTVIGYSGVAIVNSNVNISNVGIKYALFPVWMLSTRWNDSNFLFAMNGQTGKLIGDLPISSGRFWTNFLAIALSVAAIISAIYLLM